MPYAFNDDKSKFELEAFVNNARSTFIDAIYPVGSIYMSVNNTSPANLFGGTWTPIKDTFLLAAGSKYAAGSTGGEATHTLTTSEIPSHSHSKNAQTSGNEASGYGLMYGGNQGFGNRVFVTGSQNGQNTGSTGSGKAHNNMPPYLTVYMWKRTG